jgi:hydroxylysine kinase
VDGLSYALRVSHPSEHESVTGFQVAALRHIAAVMPNLPVPRVFPSLNGQDHLQLPFKEDGIRAVRLLSYLPGVPLNTVERTSEQRKALGAMSANLGISLRGLFHAAAGHELAWDLKYADRLRPLLKHIPDRDRRDLATHFLDRFESAVKPRLAGLRAQVVHNDLNAFNVLVDPEDSNKISGVLDFGDMVHTPLVNDVAVGASYQLGSSVPWATALEFIAAYHEVSPLTQEELSVLYYLIATRFVVTVTITGWRAARYPQNSAYILKNNAGAWAGLQFLSTYPRDVATEELFHACGF